jgi:hypothetical protein
MTNTSGQGPAAIFPPELDRWSWGAMLMNWIWGLGNKTYIALLMFVPVVNFVMPFVLGAKGNEWAWRNRRWDSIEHFQATQRKWAKWGVILVLLAIPGVLGMFFGISYALKNSDAYQGAVAKIMANTEVLDYTGTPLATGLPMGSIQISGPSGHAELEFSVQGPKAKGTAYVRATLDLGQWRYDRIVFEQSTNKTRIEVK